MNDVSFNWEGLPHELLSMLEEELPTFQTDLKKALQPRDMEQLQYHSHKLCGACCYTRLPKLKQLTEQLESEAKSHKKDRLNDLVEKIDQEISKVLQALKNRK